MDSRENEIYTFLKSKLKERGISVQDFYVMCGVSKATLYRVMKGHQKPTQLQRDKIIELLDLDEIERGTFIECIKMLDFTERRLLAFDALIDTLFKSAPKRPRDPMEFIVYDRDGGKTVKTDREIFSIVRRAAEADGFYCEIKIHSCIHGDFLESLEQLLAELAEYDVSVGHIVRFYEGGELENALTFKAVLPLLRHGSYSLFAQNVNGEYSPTLLEDVALIRLPDSFLVFTLGGDDRYSECRVSDRQEWFSLFSGKWDAAKARCEVMTHERNIDQLNSVYRELGRDAGIVIIKTNPCYNFFERSVWESVYSRVTQEHFDALAEQSGERRVSPEKAGAMLRAQMSTLEQRYAATFAVQSIGVCCKSGLESLAETGRLSDHYAFVPPLTREEIRASLENLLRRSSDPDDPLILTVLDRELRDDICVVATADGQISVEFIGGGDIFNCFFKQSQLAQLIYDFATKYAPEKLALRDDEVRAIVEGI